VLDLVMPELEGGEVLRRLRATPATASLPVVIVTSKALSAEERAALEAQGAVVLAKAEFAGASAPAVLRAALVRAGFSP